MLTLLGGAALFALGVLSGWAVGFPLGVQKMNHEAEFARFELAVAMRFMRRHGLLNAFNRFADREEDKHGYGQKETRVPEP